jgi:hypothetical protein
MTALAEATQAAATLSESQCRNLTGVVRDRYGILLGKMKAERKVLGLDLDGKPLGRGNTSWIAERTAQLQAERLERGLAKWREPITEAHQAFIAADNRADFVEEQLDKAQRKFEDARDKLLPVQAVDKYGFTNIGVAGISMDRNSAFYKPGRAIDPRKARVNSCEQIKALAKTLSDSLATLGPLEAGVRMVADELKVAQDERQKAERKLDAMLSRSGLDLKVYYSDETQIELASSTAAKLADKARAEAEVRYERLGELIERFAAESTEVRKQLLLAGIENGAALELVEAIPTSFENLL